MSSVFNRGIDDDFIVRLGDAKKNGWWADVLADPKLLIAVRADCLNVYWRGQSLFSIRSGAAGLFVTTHEKFLVDPALSDQVRLVDGAFKTDELMRKGFLSAYQGKPTLKKMRAAAGLYSGAEKKVVTRSPEGTQTSLISK